MTKNPVLKSRMKKNADLVHDGRVPEHEINFFELLGEISSQIREAIRIRRAPLPGQLVICKDK